MVEKPFACPYCKDKKHRYTTEKGRDKHVFEVHRDRLIHEEETKVIEAEIIGTKMECVSPDDPNHLEICFDHNLKLLPSMIAVNQQMGNIDEKLALLGSLEQTKDVLEKRRELIKARHVLMNKQSRVMGVFADHIIKKLKPCELEVK